MRKEVKYFMSKDQAFLLKKLLSCYCLLDPHGKTYTVKSLYFDTIDDSALNDKVNGVKRSGKIRVRSYNGDTRQFKLECKQKRGHHVLKQSVALDASGYRDIMTNPHHIRKYIKGIHTEGLRAKNLILYERTAYVYPMSDIRFTFDENIRSSVTKGDMFSDMLYAAVYDSSTVIFEIKYTYDIPSHLKNIISNFGLEQSISKYSYARTSI